MKSRVSVDRDVKSDWLVVGARTTDHGPRTADHGLALFSGEPEEMERTHLARTCRSERRAEPTSRRRGPGRCRLWAWLASLFLAAPLLAADPPTPDEKDFEEKP